MTHKERMEMADDLGYTSGRCPNCHRQMWSDTGRFECSCGFDSHPDEPEGGECDAESDE